MHSVPKNFYHVLDTEYEGPNERLSVLPNTGDRNWSKRRDQFSGLDSHPSFHARRHAAFLNPPQLPWRTQYPDFSRGGSANLRPSSSSINLPSHEPSDLNSPNPQLDEPTRLVKAVRILSLDKVPSRSGHSLRLRLQDLELMC